MLQRIRTGIFAVAVAMLLGVVVSDPRPAGAENLAPAPGHKLVEARIKELHTKLHVTAAQEAAWNDVAQMMRDNAKAMVEPQQDRAADAKSMNASAIDVLKSYSGVVDAHADGLHKFIPVFQKFYDTLSEEQKKTADVMFRSRARTAVKAGQMSKR